MFTIDAPPRRVATSAAIAGLPARVRQSTWLGYNSPASSAGRRNYSMWKARAQNYIANEKHGVEHPVIARQTSEARQRRSREDDQHGPTRPRHRRRRILHRGDMRPRKQQQHMRDLSSIAMPTENPTRRSAPNRAALTEIRQGNFAEDDQRAPVNNASHSSKTR